MPALARLSTRRPVVACAVWVAIAATLIVYGLSDFGGALSPSLVVPPGTEAARAEQLTRAQFGPGTLVPILLEGPRGALDSRGPRLVAALRAQPGTRVLSAWDGGSTAASMRPDPRHALVVASVAKTEKQMVDGGQATVDRVVHREISAPVQPFISGQPTIDIALQQQALADAHRGLEIALPLLLIVLLVTLRAPVAALLLTLFGGAIAVMGWGAMALLGRAIQVDGVSVTVASTVGLALGAGYALVVHRRWREEWAALRPRDRAGLALAASRAVETTGRGVAIGGAALVLALLIAPLIAPTAILISVGVGATMCAFLAVVGAVLVMPAVLTLAGDRVEAFALHAPPQVSAAWDALADRGAGVVIRRAGLCVALTTAVLVGLTALVTSLRIGPPSAQVLPAGDPARVAYEKLAAVMGPGTATPFDIVVVSQGRPITDRATLRSLHAFEVQIAADKSVKSVSGPGDLYVTTAQLKQFPQQLAGSEKLLKSAPSDLARLQSGLGQARAGSRQLRSGLLTAAAGAQALSYGAGSADSGAGQLSSGLGQAQTGAAKISGGLRSALSGARQLRRGAAQLRAGTGQALSGSQQISGGLGQAVSQVVPGVPAIKAMAGQVASANTAVAGASAATKSAGTAIGDAVSSLQAMSAGTSDPNYRAALDALARAQSDTASASSSLSSASSGLGSAAGVSAAFAAQVSRLANGLQRLYSGSQALAAGIGKLDAGAGRLQRGQGRLVAGISRLNGGGSALTAGLRSLDAGAAALHSGLGRLLGGSGRLASGLQGAPGKVTPLIAGLAQMRAGVGTFRRRLPSATQLEQLQAQSPGLFDNGYFVLAAIDGAPPAARNQASFVVNLDRGGNAGQIVVYPREPATTVTTRTLAGRLDRMTRRFVSDPGLQGAVGGPAGALADFTSTGHDAIGPVVAVESVVILVLLIALLRSVLLPVVTVVAGLLTAGATFGVMTLFYSGGVALLGGPGYMDPISIIGLFAFVFGLSIVYQVSLLQRTREALLATGDARDAVHTALARTAGSATGAAAVMLAALVPFAAATGLLTVQQFCAGAAVTVVIDALIVRPLLLPATVSLLGRGSWWPLSRRAPRNPPAGQLVLGI